jgi:hypothetical protein
LPVANTELIGDPLADLARGVGRDRVAH